MYVSERLADEHILDTFASGNAGLDEWLRRSARSAAAMRTGRTFVWADGRHVVAYYTLVAHVITRADLPKKIGRGSPDRIGAYLIARLALDKRLRGKGLGSALLSDALCRVLKAADQAAARFVVVDAIDEPAANFYVHHGFTRVPGTLRLVQKLSDVEAALTLQRAQARARPRRTFRVV